MAVLKRPRPAVRCASAVLAVTTALSPRLGIAQSVSESALKAAFLLNFAKFIEWPLDAVAATDPLVLCSADDSVSPSLEATVSGQTIEKHPVSANRVTLDGPIRDCAVLYVGKLDERRAAQLVAHLRGTAVLTVGDDQTFATSGGIIGLFVEGGRMRFAVNLGAAEQARLRLSAKLLTLARIVKD